MKKSKIGFYAEKSLIGISAFVIGWVLLCVFDINIHNMTDLNYSRWNLIRYFPIERKYCGDTKQASIQHMLTESSGIHHQKKHQGCKNAS